MSTLWEELNDFSEYERTLSCPICKDKAVMCAKKTAFKCRTCDHIFKEDGSELAYGCHCKKCNPEPDMKVEDSKAVVKKIRKKKE